MQKVIETHCLYLYTCRSTSRGWNFYHHFYKFGERMNFMKCHFKEWEWVAITILSGFLVDAMASFGHQPSLSPPETPRKTPTGLRRSSIHIHERPLCCWGTEKERNFPKRKTLLEHVNFKTTFHVHFSFESFSYFREKLFFKNWRDGRTNFQACPGTEILCCRTDSGRCYGDGASGKLEIPFQKRVQSVRKNYVTFTKYIRKLSCRHKPQAQKWFP